MPRTSIQATGYKKPLYTVLSAALLLSAVSCVSTTSLTPKENTLKTADYCRSSNDTKTLTPSKSQSVQQRAMDCMLNELQIYQQKNMSARQQYFAYKAQAWLNYANHKDSMNSRSDVGVEAAQTAENILQALKNDKVEELALIEDIPSTSALMRPDLWATISALKDSDGIAVAPREMAFSEVALIWAATNQCARGWRESGIHFRMADRWLEQARQAYVNAHDSQTNVALQARIVRYYEAYAPLDSGEDTCHGQALSPI